jgi:thioesterase domain-containing protein
MDFPSFEVEFTRDGTVFQPAQVEAVLAAVSGPTISDLVVISHGWNNDMADARQLYERFFQAISAVRGGQVVPGVATRSFAVLGVFWPSKKFTDEELIPGGGAVSAAPANTSAVLSLLEELKNDPTRLGQRSIDPARAARLEQAKALVPRLEADLDARREFVDILRAVMDRSMAHPDDGSDAFFEVDASTLFTDLSEPVVAPLAAGAGGGASVGHGSAGGAAGLRDLFGGVIGAARRLANFTTYQQMKGRAGTVGQLGVAPVIKALRARRGDLKIHLVGHSFGGRVVTAAAAALDPRTPAVTMTLLQAAYSHNGLAEKFDGTHDGFFRRVIAEQRISGPIVITHTKNDQAVGVAYPLASRVAHDKAAALGDANDPYGGMGRNGAQKTAEVAPSPRVLQDLGEALATPYAFRSGAIYNLNSDRFIGGHSDICGHQVACAVLSAVTAV